MHIHHPPRFIFQYLERPKRENEEEGTERENALSIDIKDMRVISDISIPEKVENMIDYKQYKAWREVHPTHTPFKTAEEAYPSHIRLSKEVEQQCKNISLNALPSDCNTDMEEYYNSLLYMENKSNFIAFTEQHYYIEGQRLEDIEHTKIIFINDIHSNQEMLHAFKSLMAYGFNPQEDVLLMEGISIGRQAPKITMTSWPYSNEIIIPRQTEGWELDTARKKTGDEMRMLAITSQEKKDSFMQYINTVIESMQKDNAPKDLINKAKEWRDLVESREPNSSEYIDPHKEHKGAIRDRNIGILRAIEQNITCGRIWIFCGIGHTTEHFKECLPNNTTYLYPKKLCTFEEFTHMQEEWSKAERYLKANDHK